MAPTYNAHIHCIPYISCTCRFTVLPAIDLSGWVKGGSTNKTVKYRTQGTIRATSIAKCVLATASYFKNTIKDYTYFDLQTQPTNYLIKSTLTTQMNSQAQYTIYLAHGKTNAQVLVRCTPVWVLHTQHRGTGNGLECKTGHLNNVQRSHYFHSLVPFPEHSYMYVHVRTVHVCVYLLSTVCIYCLQCAYIYIHM